MIHPTYTHKGVNACLLRLSRAKRRVVLHNRVITACAQLAYKAQSESALTACNFIIADLERRASMARFEVVTIERALGARK